MQNRHLLARPLGASHSPLGCFLLLSPRLSRLDAPRPAPAAVMRQEPARRPSSRASGAPHSERAVAAKSGLTCADKPCDRPEAGQVELSSTNEWSSDLACERLITRVTLLNCRVLGDGNGTI
jgi:hypothetical protein